MTIYTASFGNYDEIIPSADIRYDENHNPYSGIDEHFSSRMKAKLYKVLNPDRLDFWIDSSVEILNRRELEKLLVGDVTVFRHPFNKTLEEELILCHKLGYVDDWAVSKIQKLYESNQMDISKTPVYACTTLYRDHEKTEEFNVYWWSLICQYSYRDQLTFPLALSKISNLKLNVLDLLIGENEYLKLYEHNKS